MLRNFLRTYQGNLLVFGLTDLLGNIARGMVFPYASLYILALGGNAATIGLVALVAQLAGLVLLPIAGHITDHSDRVRMMVLGGFLSSGFILLMIFAPTWQVLALGVLLSGTVVFTFPVYASMVADSLPRGARGMGIGVMNTLSNSLPVFAPYAAGVILTQLGTTSGMRLLYGIMFVLYLLSAFIQMRFLREPSPVHRTPLELRALLHALDQAYHGIPALVRGMSRPLRALTLVIILNFMGAAAVGSFWVVYAIDQLHLSPEQWGIIMLVEGIVRVTLFLPAGALVDRFGRSTALLIALLVTCLVTPGFFLLPGFAVTLAVRAILSAASVLGMAACMALMADLVPGSIRGQTMAAIGQGGLMLSMVGSPGGPSVGYLIIPPVMAASLAGGLLYTWNPTSPWIFAVAAGLVSVILVALYIRDPHHAEA